MASSSSSSSLRSSEKQRDAAADEHLTADHVLDGAQNFLRRLSAAREASSPAPAPPEVKNTFDVGGKGSPGSGNSKAKKVASFRDDDLEDVYARISDKFREQPRFFSSSSKTDVSGPTDDGSMTARSWDDVVDENELMDHVWSRLVLAVDGQIQVSARDAQWIISVFQHTLESEEFLKVEGNTEAIDRRRIVQSMKQQVTIFFAVNPPLSVSVQYIHIHTTLYLQLLSPDIGEDNDDVLNYLTAHYLPLDTQAQAEADGNLEDELDSSAHSSSSSQPGKRYSLYNNWRGFASSVTTLFVGDEHRLQAAFEEYDKDHSGR